MPGRAPALPAPEKPVRRKASAIPAQLVDMLETMTIIAQFSRLCNSEFTSLVAGVHPNFLGKFGQAALAKRLCVADQRLLCTSPKAASIRVAPSRLQL